MLYIFIFGIALLNTIGALPTTYTEYETIEEPGQTEVVEYETITEPGQTQYVNGGSGGTQHTSYTINGKSGQKGQKTSGGTQYTTYTVDGNGKSGTKTGQNTKTGQTVKSKPGSTQYTYQINGQPGDQETVSYDITDGQSHTYTIPGQKTQTKTETYTIPGQKSKTTTKTGKNTKSTGGTQYTTYTVDGSGKSGDQETVSYDVTDGQTHTYTIPGQKTQTRTHTYTIPGQSTKTTYNINGKNTKTTHKTGETDSQSVVVTSSSSAQSSSVISSVDSTVIQTPHGKETIIVDDTTDVTKKNRLVNKRGRKGNKNYNINVQGGGDGSSDDYTVDGGNTDINVNLGGGSGSVDDYSIDGGGATIKTKFDHDGHGHGGCDDGFLQDAVNGVRDTVNGGITGVGDLIGNQLTADGTLLGPIGGAVQAFEAAKGALLTNAVDGVGNGLDRAACGIGNIASDALNAIADGDIVGGLQNVGSDFFDGVGSIASGLLGDATNGLGEAGDIASNFFDGL